MCIFIQALLANAYFFNIILIEKIIRPDIELELSNGTLLFLI